MTQPDPLEAAIQAGADALYHFGKHGTDPSVADGNAKVVIDAAIDSGELVHRKLVERLEERHKGCEQLLADHNRYRDENKQLKRAVGELDEERQQLRDAIRRHRETVMEERRSADMHPPSGYDFNLWAVLDDEEQQ